MLRAMAALGVLLVWASTSFAQAPDGGYRVFRPDGAGPHPAIAFVSGCSGFAPVIAPKAYERVAEKLRGHGYIVLFVDYLGRRGARNCSRGLITEGDAAKDLVAAVTWLWIYTYLGEGHFNVWRGGAMRGEDLGFSPYGGSPGARCENKRQCWGELESELKFSWCVKVKSKEGWEGWSNQPEHFGNKDACRAR